MKVFVYSTRKDEIPFFRHYAPLYKQELTFCKENLKESNVELAKGCEAVLIAAASDINQSILKQLKEMGIKYVVTRAAGTNHLDLQAMASLGLKSANVPSYSPQAISEHTIGITLALLRHYNVLWKRMRQQNYRLGGLIGKEINRMQVGIVGTGKIGYETLKAFRGLGAKVLAYDLYPNEKVGELAEYVDFATLLAQSDLISFHCPLTEENYHFINRQTIHLMKKGVYLVNTARGGLFDWEAILEGLESEQIGGLAFDVYEKEELFIRKDLKGQEPSDEIYKALLKKDQVVYTPHVGFYTDEAVANMVEYGLRNLWEYEYEGSCKNELIRE